jgi:hypothetical protein
MKTLQKDKEAQQEICSYKVLSIIQLKAVKDTQYTSDFQNKINNHDAELLL